jgi:DNA-binding NarL/FixJ family response regulator
VELIALTGEEPGNPPAVSALPIVGKIRLLLVEDHLLLREGLKALLQANEDLEIVGDVGTVADALAVTERLQPTVVLTDIALPDRPGIALVNELRLRRCESHVLFLSACKSDKYIATALDAGARGYILKDASPQVLLQGLRAVAAGQIFVCQATSDILAGRHATPLTLLTERESEVLTRIARGESNKRVAHDLLLSIKTVEKHRSNLMRKLMLHSSVELTLFAIRQGIVGQF